MERGLTSPGLREKLKSLEVNALETSRANGTGSAIGLSVRLAISIFFVSLLACAAAQDLAGRWEGSIQIPGREFDLIVDLTQAGGKNWIGSIIIPGLDVKGAPLAQLSVRDSDVSFTIKGALASERTGPATLQGRLTDQGALSGNFLQAGNSAPFVLRKTGPAQVELPPKSTAISKDLEGVWKGDYEMNGYPRHVTLTLSNRDSGQGAAQLVVVGKRTTDAPVDLVTDADGFLTIESHEIGITYEGRLKKEAGEIRGTFTLGPFELPLVLRRTP
jgi:hypothetical protein